MSHHPEDQTLQQELADTRKKLQQYADTIVSLHGELRNLRDGICKSCKQKFQVYANLVSSQAAEPAAASSSFVKRILPSQSPAKPAKATNLTQSWRRVPLTARADPIPRTSKTLKSFISNIFVSTPPILSTYTSLPPVVTASNPTLSITPITVPTAPRWYAERDATANALNMTFVRAFVPEGEVRSVRFSADGRYIAILSTSDKKASTSIYDVDTGDKRCDLEEYASQYSSIRLPRNYCLCFSPSSRKLVVGDTAGRVTVWDIPNKRIRNIFRGDDELVESVDFSPDGRLIVSTSWYSTVRIWNMRDGSTKVFDVDARISWTVRFSPNGQFVAAGSSDQIKIWNVRSGRLVKRWTGHNDSVRSVTFMPDGRGLVSGGYDQVVKCWDVSLLGTVRFDGELPVITKILGHTSSVYAVAVSPDGQWIASGLSDKRAVIWDAHGAMRQCTLIGHEGKVFSIEFSPAGSYLALGSRDGHVTLWTYTGT